MLEKKIKKKIEDTIEVDDSDIPVHEKRTKDTGVRTIKKKKDIELYK